MIQLYSGPLSMFGMKAHIAVLEKGLDHELIMVPYSDEAGYHPKHQVVSNVNPKQQVPVLIHDDLKLFDSTQIFEYFEDLKPKPRLWPTGINARAQARQLELKADEIYFPHVVKLMYLQEELTQPAALEAISACSQFYQSMEQQLAEQTFFMGEFSYVDITFFMTQLFGERMGAPLNEMTPKLLQWRQSMTERHAVKLALKPMVKFLHSVNRPVPDYINFPF